MTSGSRCSPAAYHTGADTALMPVDEKALAYVGARAEGRPYFMFPSDPDADYVQEAATISRRSRPW